MTDGYSMSGSQAKSVALKPGGSFSGGKRFSVAGPVGDRFSPPMVIMPTQTHTQAAATAGGRISRLPFHEDLKTRLHKIAVAGQGLGQAELVHRHEGNAIRK